MSTTTSRAGTPQPPPASSTSAPPVDGGGWASVFDYWWLAYLRTWRGSLVSSFLSPLMYLAAMGYGLGALVDRGDGIAGTAYVAFIAPGVLAATAMQTGAGESSYPIMGALKWNQYFHAMLATPLNVRHLVAGFLAYVAVRLAIVSVVFVAVAVLLGAMPSWWTPLALPAAVLTGLAFAAPTVAFAARQQDDGGFNVLFRFVITPMFLFSGTFFPVDLLPTWLQPVAWATPLWHGVELTRGATLGTGTVTGTVGHVAYLLVWVLVGGWLAERFLRQKLAT